MQIGIILPTGLEDAILATSALDVLRRHYARATFTAVAGPPIAELLGGLTFFDEIIIHDRAHAGKQARFWSVVGKLRHSPPDLMIVMSDTFQATYMAWLSCANQIVGFRRGWRTLMVNVPAVERPDADARSRRARYLALVRAAGCPSKRIEEAERPILATRPRDEIACDDILRENGMKRDQSYIIVNRGSPATPARNWTDEGLAELARRSVNEFNTHVLLLSGVGDRTGAESVWRMVNHPSVHCLSSRPLTIGIMKACVRRSRLVVTTDDPMRYVASAFEVPTVTLFGPTDPQRDRVPKERAVYLDERLDCRPCERRRCPLRHQRCLRDLSPDAVFSVVRQAWTSLDQSDAA